MVNKLVHPQYGILQNTFAQTHMHTDQSPDADSEKPIPKGYTVYDPIYVTFLSWQHCRNGKWIGGCWGLRRGWDGREVGVAIKIAT